MAAIIPPCASRRLEGGVSREYFHLVALKSGDESPLRDGNDLLAIQENQPASLDFLESTDVDTEVAVGIFVDQNDEPVAPMRTEGRPYVAARRIEHFIDDSHSNLIVLRGDEKPVERGKLGSQCVERFPERRIIDLG